jgi:DNA-binding transcriptional LysR family regulator
MHAAALKYVEAVARAGSIRQAAERLNVAASAIDRQILKLEESLGVQLFERMPRGLRITPAGELVLRHIRMTLHEFDRLQSEIDQIKGIKSGSIRIACLDSLMLRFIPDALELFHKAHPAVTFTVVGATHGAVAKLVADGQADVGVTFNLPSGPELEYFSDVPMPIVAVVARDHPLAGRRSLTAADCAAYPLLLQEDIRPIRSLIDIELLGLRDLRPPLVVSNNMMLLKPMIIHGLGISFYSPIGFLDELASGVVVGIPLEVEPFKQLRVGLMVHRRRKPTPAASAFLALLRERLVDLGAEVERLVYRPADSKAKGRRGRVRGLSAERQAIVRKAER